MIWFLFGFLFGAAVLYGALLLAVVRDNKAPARRGWKLPAGAASRMAGAYPAARPRVRRSA
jgi:hypothetical protein